MSNLYAIDFDGTCVDHQYPYIGDDAAVGCPLVHPEGFERPCVDWLSIADLLNLKLPSVSV